jgi:lysophospholipase L1-like esterase
VILQIGDSHTAGDRFSGRLRSQLQARFGDAGRGYLQPGVPYAYYNPTGVLAEQSEGWEATGSLSRNAEGPFGLSGYRQTAQDAGEVMILTTDSFAGFDDAWLQIAAQPGGGRLLVSADGNPVGEISTDANRPEARLVRLAIPPDTRSLRLETLDDAPTSLAGWGVTRDQPGIVLDAIGVGGATVSIVDNWSPDRVGAEIAERDPSLVILAFGTNEGFDDTLDLASYRQTWSARIGQIRRWAPNAAIAVVGPPDGNRRVRACPDIDQPELASCAPLTPTDIENYTALVADDADGPDLCNWHPPPSLAEVRAIQQDVAASMGAWYWDWSTVMGGSCGIHDWVLASTPLAYDDHVHLRDGGYVLSADRFYTALMQRYSAWAGGSIAEASFNEAMSPR